MNEILKKVGKKHKWLEENKEQYGISHVVMTSLVGSQNYDLSTPSSDIDTYSFIFPSYIDFICGKSPKNFEHTFEDGSKIVVKDIRLAFNLLRKPTPNSIECFLSHYKVYNPLFESILTYYLEDDNLLSLITHCNYTNMVNAIAGCAQGLNGRNMSLGKIYSHALRLQDMLMHYLDPYCSPLNYISLEPDNLHFALMAKLNLIDVQEQSYLNLVDTLKTFAKNYKISDRNKIVEEKGKEIINEFQIKLTEKFLEIGE